MAAKRAAHVATATWTWEHLWEILPPSQFKSLTGFHTLDSMQAMYDLLDFCGDLSQGNFTHWHGGRTGDHAFVAGAGHLVGPGGAGTAPAHSSNNNNGNFTSQSGNFTSPKAVVKRGSGPAKMSAPVKRTRSRWAPEVSIKATKRARSEKRARYHAPGYDTKVAFLFFMLVTVGGFTQALAGALCGIGEASRIYATFLMSAP